MAASNAELLADSLFGGGGPAPPPTTASGGAGSLVPRTVTHSHQPSTRASAVPLAEGTVVNVTRETWREGQVDDGEVAYWTFVPESILAAPAAEGQSPPAAAGDKPPSAHAHDPRYKVARELMMTEESYGKALHLIKDTLMGPLSQGSVLPPQTIAKIFSCSDRISELSDALLEQMRAAVETWDGTTTRVSDVFAAHIERSGLMGSCRLADLYVQYVNNYEQSSRARRAADEVVEWTYFLKHWRLLTEAMGRGSHELDSLLIQPVQRMPRYKLLLEELLKSTPADHPDRAGLEHTLERISSIATKVG